MLMYLLIMFAKIIEVSLMTIRVVLVTKGEKTIGSIIGFVEVLIWIYIVGSVLGDISADPIKAVFYALGFALGNYVGLILEEKIGIGISEIQVIVDEEDGDTLVSYIRDQGYAVTVVEGEGYSKKRDILYMFVRRKRVKSVINMIQDQQSNSVITISETKPVYGGYGLVRK